MAIDRILHGQTKEKYRQIKLSGPIRQGDKPDRARFHFVTQIDQVAGLTEIEKQELKKVSDTYRFRTNSYYLSLIDWDNPDDPIRKLIIPSTEELKDIDGDLEKCNEKAITVAPGCAHKYEKTALIAASNVCGAVCRFCFRKRIFMSDNHEINPDIAPAINYIKHNPGIDNVLVTGGDSFMLSTGKITRILEKLREISHVKIIRLGTKLLAFNPFRFLDDPDLIDVLARHSFSDSRIHIVGHFNHPNEITDYSIEAVNLLQSRKLQVLNQTPLLQGVNDNPDALASLFTTLSRIGVAPYYFFQCRPTKGNAHFKVPFIKGLDTFESAKKKISGLAKRARYVGSHASGKIEIIGYDSDHMYFRYLQSRDAAYYGQFFKLPRNDEATWWDDWMPGNESFSLETCPDVCLGSGTC